MLSSTKSVLPTITDQSASLQLSNSSKQLTSSLTDLRAAIGRAQEAVGGQLHIDSALDVITHLENELLEFRKAAQAFELQPLPGETVSSKLYIPIQYSSTIGTKNFT